MEKFGVFLIVISTLITIAPYIWLFIDIMDEASKRKILIDAAFTGPSLVLCMLIWIFCFKYFRKHREKCDVKSFYINIQNRLQTVRGKQNFKERSYFG